MTKKTGIIYLLSTLIVIGSALVIATEGQAETYNWKLSSPYPPGDTANQDCDGFAKMVEERSNGRVKITLYMGGLGSPRDAWDMVTNNTVQFTWTGDLYNPGRMPVTQMIGLPFEIPSVKMAYDIVNQLLAAGYLKEYENLKPLYFLPSYPIGIYTTKKKITKIEDFQGMKIRCGTGIQGQALIALGASTVSLPGSEEYMSLQTGVIDGTITGINIGIHRKLHEVVKYAIKEPPLFYGILFMLMNKQTWESAPPDIKEIIMGAAKEVATKEVKKIEDQEQQMWSEFSQKVDCYTINPEEQSRWRKAINKIGDDYAAEISKKGYQGNEALSLIRKMIAK